MGQGEPVPADVHAAAARVYVRAPDHSAEDAAAVLRWAAARYPHRHPSGPAACAFWALSVAFAYGVA